MKKKLNLQTILIGVVAILLVIILIVQLSGGKGETRMEQLKTEAEPIAEVTSSTEPAVSTDDRGNEISGMGLEVVTWLKQGFGDSAEVIYIEEKKTFSILIDDEALLTSSSFIRKFVNPLIDYSKEISTTYGEGYIFYIGDTSGLEAVIAVLMKDGQVMIDNLSY